METLAAVLILVAIVFVAARLLGVPGLSVIGLLLKWALIALLVIVAVNIIFAIFR